MTTSRFVKMSMAIAASGFVVNVTAAASAQKVEPDHATPHFTMVGEIKNVDDLARQADVIIRGRCKKSEMVERPTPLDEQTIMAEYDVDVTEVLKDDGRVPDKSKMTLVVVGGSRLNGVLKPPVGTLTPALKRDDEVVLFLRWWPGLNGYIIHGDATGAFKLTDSEVVPYREAFDVASRLPSVSPQAFLDYTKAAARKNVKP